MQNPSNGVQPPLDRHVHLLSSNQYPPMAQLNIQQAFEYLIQAPIVVKQVAPMAWTYVNAPNNGTVWLEWVSPAHTGGRFPSDGYVWADPEQAFQQHFNGYTIEILVHQAGFKPQFEHMTLHARTRYHLVAKAPNVNAAPPDPSLWIVHYHDPQQQRVMPATQVPVDADTKRVMSERQWLESQGRIERREFMLHDREHWPQITLPALVAQQQMQRPGFYPPNAIPNQGMMPPNRYNQQPFPAPGGTPAAKRQRTQGPHIAQGDAGADSNIEEEEYTALGDYFDHLTPREISLARYQQHHDWIEEVFSSAYASADIVPPDLGLGLMGELKGLTEGILNAPNVSELVQSKVEMYAVKTPAQPFTNVPKDQLEQFNERVQKHIDEGKAEIERMKAEHAAKMRAWRNTHKLTKAERQLRHATWKGHESTLFAASNEGPNNDHAEVEKPVSVEDLIESVEQLTGQRLKTYTDATMIEKGGLEEIERATHASSTSQQRPNGAGNGANTVPQQAADSTSAAQASVQAQPALDAGHDGAGMDDGDGLDLLNDSMDIDAGDLHFDLGDTPAEQLASANDTPKLEQGQSSTSGIDKQADGGVSSAAGVQQDDNRAQQANTVPSGNDGTNEGAQGDNSMFNDSAFEFENNIGNTGDDDVGDGLIDFGDDGMGMDDNFGDALHGMDP